MHIFRAVVQRLARIRRFVHSPVITSEREARSEFLLITSEAEGRASSTENKGKS